MFKKLFSSLLALLMVLSLSSCSLFSKKDVSNKLPPQEILVNAKKEIAKNLKTSIEKGLKKWQTDYFTYIKKNNSGDNTLTLSFDHASTKIDLELVTKSLLNNAKLSSINENSSMLDLLSAMEGNQDMALKIKIKDKANDKNYEVKADVKLSYKDMVFYFALTNLEMPNEMYLIGPTAQYKAAVEMYKNKWFKVDFNVLATDNPLLKTVLSQKIWRYDAEKITKLVSAYLDEVFVKYDFVVLDVATLAKTDDGDSYVLKLTPEIAKKLAEAHLDFVVAHLNEIDEILDITQKNNFVLDLTGAKRPSLEEISTSLKEERERFLKSFEKLPDLSAITIKAVLALDKLAKITIESKEAKDGTELMFNSSLNFEEGSQDLEKTNIVGDLSLKEGKVKMTLKFNIHELSGSDRESSININYEEKKEATENRGEGTMTVSSTVNLTQNAENELSYLKGDLSVKDYGSPDQIKGINAFVKYTGGEKQTLNGEIGADPKELFYISFSGSLSEKDINGKATLNFGGSDQTKTDKFDLSAAINGKMNTENKTVEMPKEISSATDVTKDLQQQVESMLMLMLFGFAAGTDTSDAALPPADALAPKAE